MIFDVHVQEMQPDMRSFSSSGWNFVFAAGPWNLEFLGP